MPWRKTLTKKFKERKLNPIKVGLLFLRPTCFFCIVVKDLLSLYVLFSHFMYVLVPQRTVSFKCHLMHVHPRAYVCIINKNANFLGEHHVVWIVKTKPTSLLKRFIKNFFLFLFKSLNNKDCDFELSEELSDADNESDDQDDSDFNETEVKKKSKGRGRGKSTSSPARAGVKPRTSVTGL